MARALQPATSADVQRVTRALGLLREARDLLTDSGADKAAERVRSAIPSTEGALRHVERRARTSARAAGHEV